MVAKAKRASSAMRSTIFTVPAIVPDVAFAVLRRECSGHRNDARVYASNKLHPINRPATLNDYRPEVRHEVLLPDDAEDRLADAKLLFEDYEAKQVPAQKDLVTHVKISTRVRRLHHLYEDGRQFARQEIVRKESMAVLMIMHVPQLSPPHLHLLIPCRRLTPTGWSDFVQELACDGGCKRVSEAWEAFKLTL